MLAPQALLKGITQRLAILALGDGPEAERILRAKKYGDLGVENVWPTDHEQCDEGSLFVASTLPGGTALQLGLSGAFSATAAAFALFNSDINGKDGKRVYPKSLRLAQSVAPTAGIDLRYAIVLDKDTRRPTTIANATGSDRGPGTPATATAYRSPVYNTNLDVVGNGVGVPYFPLSIVAGAPPAVPGPGPDARTIVGNGYIKNSIPVAKDQYVLQFGKADIGGTFQGAAALAKIVEHAPAVCIPPQCWMLIYLWSASNITAGNAWDDVSMEWVER